MCIRDRCGNAPVKLLEYNADTPTSLYESAYFQWLWLEDARRSGVIPVSYTHLIPPDQIMGARMGFVVVVELTQRPTRRTKAVGKIV